MMMDGKEYEMTLEEIVKEAEKEMGCNCDLDNWQPETDTGHSWVCRIHKAAKARFNNQSNKGNEDGL